MLNFSAFSEFCVHLFAAEVFAFNVDAPSTVKQKAVENRVPLQVHQVIYHMFDEMLKSMNARLPVIHKDETIG